MQRTLEFIYQGAFPVDFSGIIPEKVLEMPVNELKKTTILVGNDRIPLGDVCRLKTHLSQKEELILSGNTSCINQIGAKMTMGRLIVLGSTGHFVGLNMSGGEIEIRGNAGTNLGANMQGGFIRCSGDTGDYAGAALDGHARGMNGGMILIAGSTGKELGSGMRRGIIIVGHNAGELTGVDMLAGSIFVFGSAGSNLGLNMRRGSIIVNRLGDSFPVGFLDSGRGDAIWLRVYFNSISSMGIRPPKGWSRDSWKRFTGDHVQSGKGELYIYDPVK